MYVSDDGDYLPFEIYTYGPADAIVDINGGMYSRRVNRRMIAPFITHVMNQNITWSALPDIPGPWRSSMPTFPNHAAFYAPSIERPLLERNPNVHGPPLAARLRERARKISRTQRRRTHVKQNLRPRLHISSNSGKSSTTRSRSKSS